jgi:hypothetical protein
MREMEAQLHSAEVGWTSVRSGWLMDCDLTADYTVTPDVIPQDLIRTRMTDAAHLMLDLAESGAWSRQTLAIAPKVDDEKSSRSTVIRNTLA